MIANAGFILSGEGGDAGRIMPAVPSDIPREAGRTEANVATGDRAIELLLAWQGPTGDAPVAGPRRATGFVQGGVHRWHR